MALKFALQISLKNAEGQDDLIFDSVIEADSEVAALEAGDLPAHWKKADDMAGVRADDGTKWAAYLECLSVTSIETGQTDWHDDTLPQRDEVTEILTELLKKMVPSE